MSQRSSLPAPFGAVLDSRLFRIIASFTAVYMASSLVLRVTLTFFLDTSSWADAPLKLLAAVAIGSIHDLFAGVGLISLFLLLIFLFVPRKKSFSRGLLFTVFAAFFVGMLFIDVAELLFWQEFSNRFNGIAVFYLIFPREVIGNIYESFPVEYELPAVFAAGIALWYVAGRKTTDTLARLFREGSRWRLASTALLTAVVAGLLSAYAHVRPFENREFNEMAENGLRSLFYAALSNDEEYEGVYPSIKDHKLEVTELRKAVKQENSRFVKPTGPNPILRQITPDRPTKKLNIVIAIEESFGAKFVDYLDNKTGVSISPNLNRLAKEGVSFTNVYASGDRTVRGLEAVLTSFAPIPGISTARRDGSRHMFSLPYVLKQQGYNSGILYGGEALFDNMGTFWDGIGFDHVWDENDIRHESFSTIWGVSDEDLFTEALQRMDENAGPGKAPFLLSMMTVSNHRPYKFPQDHVKWKDDRGRIENTATYADWAFGNFIERARSKPWFDDTVFVFVADHSRKINGASRIPVDAFRIPIVFYSPKHLKPMQVDKLMAQIDLSPTLLGLLGFKYDSPFFGVDVLKQPNDDGRIIISHNFSIAYGRPGQVVVLEPTGDTIAYDFKVGEQLKTRATPDPALREEAISVVQTAHRMFYAGDYHYDNPAFAKQSLEPGNNVAQQ
ncbi:LTA synthase family protein [Aestuariispira ectoiniformans]|uniref:LTA synthase family protein n=1 Tax=Aestuariispira ectoiniformans TaxID=2775080 RepID=UPI00223C2C28|nr:LTA synthase family protein [Aestuariispira ectoiniformans]